MRNLKTMLLGIALIWLTGITAGCSSPVEVFSDAPDMELPQGERLTAAFTDARLPGMKGIADNDRLQLYVQDETAEIAVIDKSSGEIWRSNPAERDSDAIAAGVNKDMLSAQSRISFFNLLGQNSSVNTYTDSIAFNQAAFEPVPEGVRVTYQFGRYEPSVDDMPQMLSRERFEEITGELDSGGQRALIIAYREDKDLDLYVRNDGSLRGLQLQRALAAFEAAGYTEEDLERDIAENNLDQTKPVPRIFMLAVEYTLDGDSLIAKVPVDSIQHSPDYPINQFSLLNFFGTGGAEETGSLFVPDGSGALIHFNNGKTNYPAYQQVVFGRDLTMDNTDFLTRDQKIRMPVFGMIKENGAFLGIIEQGASAAVINADVSGRLNSFNFVYPSFYYRNKDDVTLSAGVQQRSLPRFQEEPMKTDYVVRYAFLNGNDASYEGMAGYYQQYLANRQLLTQAPDDTNEDIPFYLQLVGSINKQKHALGVPYRALVPLTALDEAKVIVSELQERNIGNIRLKYTGWFNGGVEHSVPSKISVDDAIGGRRALSEFMAYSSEAGVSFFPDISLLSFSNTSGFSTSGDAARRLTGAPAALYPIDQAINRRDRTRTPSYLLSPRKAGDVADSMLDDLQRLQVGSISLRDLADYLNSDYRRGRHLDRTESETLSIQALRSLHEEGLRMMADGGNAYALPYVTDITNAPISNSHFKLEDESIPFYQMVVRGYIDYTGAPYNLSTYTNPRQYLLKCLEYGSHIYFTWTYEQNSAVKDTEYDYLYAVHYREWIDLAWQMYDELNEVLGHVKGQRIVSHEKMDDGVFKTEYENGFYVIVNYNASSVTVDGVTIEAESFATGGEQS